MDVVRFGAVLTTAGVIGLLAIGLAAQAPTEAPRAAPPGPLERSAQPIGRDNPVPRRVLEALPEYPSGSAAAGQTGTVILRITVDASGRVAEWRQPLVPDFSVWPNGKAPDGGVAYAVAAPLPAAFVDAAASAVTRWRYDVPVRGPISLYVKFRFVPDRRTELLWHDAHAPEEPAALTATRSRLGSGVPGGVAGGIAGGSLAVPPPPPPAAPARVGGTIQAPTRIKHVAPVYPPIAQAARIQGVVIIEAVIDGTGRVADARVLRSIKLLDQAALDAVRQWEFTPTLLNGRPTNIIMSVSVSFTLTDKEPAGPTAPPASPPPPD